MWFTIRGWHISCKLNGPKPHFIYSIICHNCCVNLLLSTAIYLQVAMEYQITLARPTIRITWVCTQAVSSFFHQCIFPHTFIKSVLMFSDNYQLSSQHYTLPTLLKPSKSGIQLYGFTSHRFHLSQNIHNLLKKFFLTSAWNTVRSLIFFNTFQWIKSENESVVQLCQGLCFGCSSLKAK